MNIIVFPHLGLGDQLIMNGYIHNLLNTIHNIEEICIIAKQYQQKTLEHLYSDFTQITFYWVQETSETSGSSWQEKDFFLRMMNGAPFGSSIHYKGKEFILHNFGCHTNRSFNIQNNNWADAFYIQGGADPILRKQLIFPSQMKESEELYSKVKEFIGGKEYILVHDDPTRNRMIDTNLFKKIRKMNETDHLSVLYLGKQRYNFPLQNINTNAGNNDLLAVDSLFNYYHLIQNARECHFMDSSIACMTDLIKGSQSNLNLHSYITHSVDPKFPIFINRKWSIWYEEDLTKNFLTVSIIIASYNRFDSLLDTIKSIQMQTYPVLEIIVVNDGSDDPRYKSVDIPGITMLHNEVNTKQIYGFPNISHVRNKGIQAAKGDYIAFCDDDDVWLPHKIEMQMARMMEDNTDFCSTDGFYCAIPWNSQELGDELRNNFHGKYPKYNAEHYWNRLKDLFGGIREFPRVWTYPFVMRHNGIILSSVILHRKVLERVGMFHDLNMRENPEDYDLWKRVIQQFPMSYVETPCFGWAAYPYKYG